MIKHVNQKWHNILFFSRRHSSRGVSRRQPSTAQSLRAKVVLHSLLHRGFEAEVLPAPRALRAAGTS